MPIEAIRPATELFYDLQKLRIATSNRTAPKAEHNEVVLPEDDKEFLERVAESLEALEKEALRHAAKKLKGVPIYEDWLRHQMGVGPTMAAVILGSIDIHKATTVSKLWKYAGIDVMANGQGRRRVKGERIRYNPWLKTKLMGVLADLFVRAAVIDEETGEYVKKAKGVIVKRFDREDVWRRFYDDYKHRKQTQRVQTCLACDGRGAVLKTAEQRAKFDAWAPDAREKLELREKHKCANCDGTGGPAPWGRSDAHRAQAAKRYMIKMFLLELHKRWRESEGLEVRPPYQEAYLGHAHA